ncbi:MAG: 16S rRNA (adenine(1518)-N(6)/adenine(1519)-N(6))-dimethyltransferase RsmA [Candidatus Paceibacterota bacterium]|jgi:16S rRNA (adenine1518-N6/adenine1519-N6)-dimethyltransferase|nr:16S rRNA (adenine(1518)-N(6)/adenine(1519)-N(6))-dimethyltransferase RsmA [Candidatus Paceibacterota bacterium]MDD5555160.1 16S rRNA (adenine(1518)-N(6)/adenine(1519)-N(6))-dimethyltransferase RsmA [Candidatus Paceibacterota bacterium]
MSSSFSTVKTQGIIPKKSLGQNFLIDQNIVRKFVRAAKIGKNDVILEIGPGLGALTREMALYAKKIVAVEKDESLSSLLKDALKKEGVKNVEIITGDVLKKLPEMKKGYKAVANAPYYLISFLIRKLLESENKPKQIVFFIQKEMAKRICAKPPEMNLLAVSVNFYAKPEIAAFVSKNCFWPKPKTDSAIIIITPFKRKKDDLFFTLVKAGFSHPRKQVANNLSKGLKMEKENIEAILKKNGINSKARAQELSVDDWLNLSLYFSKENIVKESGLRDFSTSGL